MGSEGFVGERLQTVEPVPPAADDDDLIEPGIQGVDQTREMFDIGIGVHQGLFSSMEEKTRRQICSAWAAPRAGCEPTSSQTWRMSAAGTPLFSTAPRKTDSRNTGKRLILAGRCGEDGRRRRHRIRCPERSDTGISIAVDIYI